MNKLIVEQNTPVTLIGGGELGEADLDLALYHGGERPDAPLLLELSLQDVCDQGAVHVGGATPRQAMGARVSARNHAATPGSGSESDADTATDGRASLRHAQVLDGLNTLPDAHARACANGNESACAGLQYDPRHEHDGHSGDDRRDEGLIGLIRLQFCTYTSGCA